MADTGYQGIDNLEVLEAAVRYSRFLVDRVAEAGAGCKRALDFVALLLGAGIHPDRGGFARQNVRAVAAVNTTVLLARATYRAERVARDGASSEAGNRWARCIPRPTPRRTPDSTASAHA